MTYLITFACYGCHPHGDGKGSIDPQHNVPGTPLLPADSTRLASAAERMLQPPYQLDQRRRDVVLSAIQDVCGRRGWNLLAAHVRSNHVHIVVEAKVYASHHLNQMKLDEPNRKRWARHGSTRCLPKRQQVSAAIQYVVNEQGEPMSVFEAQG